MYVIDVNNVNEALPKGIDLLLTEGVLVTSRGMETVEMPGPVSTVYRDPTRRVLFDEVRDANPFFHLMESLWIIGGSNNVALPKLFMSTIDRFSDDGVTFHGAYGWRLRNGLGFDQLAEAIKILITKPDSRQVVLSIWHAAEDLGTVTKDLPCNDMIMLKVRDGRLNMTVCNRSNDMIWGAYGANVVQFSMLQEWLAHMIGVGVGHYVQQSDSFHAYTDNPFWVCASDGEYPYNNPLMRNPYSTGEVTPWPIAMDQTDARLLQRDCEMLCEQAEFADGDLLGVRYQSTFFQDVVIHVIGAYLGYKAKKWAHARLDVSYIQATDWQLAMGNWINARQRLAAAKEQA